MSRVTPTLVAAAFITANTAYAVDHANLDKNRPLRIDDAYSIAAGELALEFGFGFDSRRNTDDQFFAPLELLWGAAPNLQIGIGTIVISEPHQVDEQSKSADIGLSALYNFNQETTLPAFGIRGDLNLPTGVDSSGVDGEITAIITKSFGNISLHFNAGYEFLGGVNPGERTGLYNLAFGASLPLGAPMHTRTVLITDLFIDQASFDGEDDAIGVEAGFRHQLSERIVIDGGIGTEFEGPDDRSELFAMLGLSLSF